MIINSDKGTKKVEKLLRIIIYILCGILILFAYDTSWH